MTQVDSVGKTDSMDFPRTDRKDFLGALYGTAPDDLFLELRCLHPETAEVKVFWGKLGNKRQLAAQLKQADAFNRAGYGVYFAPCLRKTQSGKAEAAALAPVLWVDIDCDGNEAKREAALEKLHGFDLPPSAILNSGGGWHVYWLLSEAKVLETDSHREQMAALLRGLSMAVGADDAYVKSAASLMRLPNSINTKPERNGAVVSIVEFSPERTYGWEDFAWLEAAPEASIRSQFAPLNENGTHPLPRRTGDYIANGAGKGSRNVELFAAACQMRDAGYSQADAERELIPRHVANGSNEREALATIRSAFSKSPREPIPEPVEAAHTKVARLVEQHTPDRKRPSSAELAEAVEACAHLNAIEWAEERTQLKALCGDGLKVSDLDRMYRQAKQALQRQSFGQGEESECYVLVDGGMVFERITERGISRQRIANWSGKVVERVSRVDDDGQVEHLVKLELKRGEMLIPLTLPSELFGDPNALQRMIAKLAGETFIGSPGAYRHLGSALLALSGDYPCRITYRFLGWNQIEGKWALIGPGCAVNAEGVISTPPEVELKSRLRDYTLTDSSWKDSLKAYLAAAKVFPKQFAASLTAFSLLPLVQRFFPTAAPKPALHLVGTTGSGKSEIAALMASFYGQFTRDTPPAQWGDTVNTVEALGYSLADALYWVDDYKTIYADERTFTRFLQSYSRGMGRGRMTREAKLRQDKPCRGLLLSTGETTLEGEASVLARMLVLAIPPWEKRDPGGAALAEAQALRADLPGFTAHFARWIAAQADAGTLTKWLSERFAANNTGYRDKLSGQGGKNANTGRVIQNWAVLATMFQLLCDFMAEHDSDHLLPMWEDNIGEMVRAVQGERAGQLFLDLLGQLLAGGQCVIDDDLRHPREYAPGTTIVGYRDAGFIYMLPDIVLREISKTHPLRFTKQAIGDQLKEEGLLIPGTGNLTVQRSVRGSVVRLWRMKAEILGCEDCESCEDVD